MSNRISLFTLICFLSQVTFGADIKYLRSSITNHLSDNRNHEVYNGYKTSAKEFIYDEFKKNGLETEYHTFNYPDVSKMVSFVNVVGIMKGTSFGTKNDQIVGLGAHYDTVRDTKGVDDNGSGVAAMLEVVRQLGSQNKKGVKRKNTVMFVSFDLEEYDYVGSKVFIQGWLNRWLAENYGHIANFLVGHGIIVLDTMMEYNTSAQSQTIPHSAEKISSFPKSFRSIMSDDFQGDFLAMIYRSASDALLANSLRASWKAEKRPEFEFESFALPFTDVQGLNDTFKNSKSSLGVIITTSGSKTFLQFFSRILTSGCKKWTFSILLCVVLLLIDFMI